MRKSANQTFTETTTWNNKALEPGATLEGKYIGTDVFDGQFGETTKYIIEDNNGTKWGVYSSASLSRQFKKIPEGSYVWIEYVGLVTSKNGRNVKQFNVDYDDEV